MDFLYIQSNPSYFFVISLIFSSFLPPHFFFHQKEKSFLPLLAMGRFQPTSATNAAASKAATSGSRRRRHRHVSPIPVVRPGRLPCRPCLKRLRDDPEAACVFGVGRAVCHACSKGHSKCSSVCLFVYLFIRRAYSIVAGGLRGTGPCPYGTGAPRRPARGTPGLGREGDEPRRRG